ncbi:MAG: glutamine synthetase [Actinomycetia bacterium]|nr:glutamine synthetase [Actinomycetes bacterium]
MDGMLTLDQVRDLAARGELDTVVVAIPDLYGRLVGKRFTARFFIESAHEETHACDYLLAADIEMEPVPGYQVASWDHGYGDFVMRPDLSTMRLLPWLSGTALVLADVLDHHHQPVAHSPRAILQRQVERLAELGFEARMASELEFYLFTDSYEQAYAKGFRDLQTDGVYIEDYHVLATTRHEAVVGAMRQGLEGAGIPVENSKGEWGPGQLELNVTYADPVTMADRHVILKNAAKEIAGQHDQAVTFMAKWRDDLAGSSCHVHCSVVDAAGDPVFLDSGARHGLSATARQWLAGQLAHTSELTFFLAPFVNSYKRYVSGTFAPTTPVWSPDNRTAGFRLCAEGTPATRFECRIGGADLNPYLAFAALLAAGIAGLEAELDLPDPHAGDAYTDTALPLLPANLRQAGEALDGSSMLRAALGDGVVDHYVHMARWEQAQHDRRVTDLDLRRGFEQA